MKNLTNSTIVNCTTNYDSSSNVTTILRGYVATLLIVFGLLGNFLIVVVLRRREMRAKINQSLVALAVWDALLLVGGAFQYSYITFRYGDTPGQGQIVYSYLFLFPWTNAAKTGSVWTMLATACERYFAIACPLRHKYLVTGRKIRYCLLFLAVLAVLYSVPRYFEIQVEDIVCMTAAGNYSLIPRIFESPLRSNRIYYGIVYTFLNPALTSLGPFFLQAILAIRISVFVNSSIAQTQRFNSSIGRNRQATVRRRSQERNMTLMLLVVQIKFLICFMLPVFLNLAEFFMSGGRSSEEFFIVITVSDLCVLANSALNFLIYTTFTRRFRNTLFFMAARLFGVGMEVNSSSASMMMKDYEGVPTIEAASPKMLPATERLNEQLERHRQETSLSLQSVQ